MAHHPAHRRSSDSGLLGTTVPTADDITERFDDTDPTNENARRRIEALMPKARLMMALLRDALTKARTLSRVGPMARAADRKWLCSGSAAVFSAQHCCQILNLDHSALCRALRRQWMIDDAAFRRRLKACT
jgi:hypothetical protein